VLRELTYAVGGWDNRSTHGRLQPGFGHLAFNVREDSLQQVCSAGSNEGGLHQQGNLIWSVLAFFRICYIRVELWHLTQYLLLK